MITKKTFLYLCFLPVMFGSLVVRGSEEKNALEKSIISSATIQGNKLYLLKNKKKPYKHWNIEYQTDQLDDRFPSNDTLSFKEAMPRKDQDNEENERKTSERSAQQKRIDNAINNKLKDDISDLKKKVLELETQMQQNFNRVDASNFCKVLNVYNEIVQLNEQLIFLNQQFQTLSARVAKIETSNGFSYKNPCLWISIFLGLYVIYNSLEQRAIRAQLNIPCPFPSFR
ncbi:hypothetical protein IPH25_02840 [bacterium]|nr:MAG: hypothetical protein IPG37_04980 [bacterium]QQR61403.1 MAG: hypothetical protein IPH25_02840 [bacterium]QQR63075.1 MAG: hypothetical protein IPH67_01195 [bacterium]